MIPVDKSIVTTRIVRGVVFEDFTMLYSGGLRVDLNLPDLIPVSRSISGALHFSKPTMNR